MQKTPSDPWVGKIPWRREWKATPCLEDPMDRGNWWSTVLGVAESGTTEGLMLGANPALAPALLPTC